MQLAVYFFYCVGSCAALNICNMHGVKARLLRTLCDCCSSTSPHTKLIGENSNLSTITEHLTAKSQTSFIELYINISILILDHA